MLIAMVTQVIGDNVARAFSLVGALAIVRFRTVVRDTQDTAFVMLSVVVGMAVGARAPLVAVIGLALVAVVAIGMKPPATGDYITGRLPLLIRIRIGLGHDAETLLGGTLDVYFSHRRLRVDRDGQARRVDRRGLRGEDAGAGHRRAARAGAEPARRRAERARRTLSRVRGVTRRVPMPPS